MANWPQSIPYTPVQDTIRGGPQLSRASFQPDVGPPIERPRTTGMWERFTFLVQPMSRAQFATFRSWFVSDLGGGVMPFVFRHPVSGEVREARVIGDDLGFQVERSGGKAEVALTVLLAPFSPWYASYVAAGSTIAPSIVGDFAAQIYGS